MKGSQTTWNVPRTSDNNVETICDWIKLARGICIKEEPEKQGKQATRPIIPAPTCDPDRS